MPYMPVSEEKVVARGKTVESLEHAEVESAMVCFPFSSNSVCQITTVCFPFSSNSVCQFLKLTCNLARLVAGDEGGREKSTSSRSKGCKEKEEEVFQMQDGVSPPVVV
jgi:hypothetical protein